LNAKLIESLEYDIINLDLSVKEAEQQQNELRKVFNDKGYMINNIQKQIEQKDTKKDKLGKNINEIGNKIRNIELILGQNNQDILSLYKTLQTLMTKSEKVEKDKRYLQADLMEIEDEINNLDDTDPFSYGIVEAKTAVETINSLINKLEVEVSTPYG